MQSAVAPGNEGHTQNWVVGKKGSYIWSEPLVRLITCADGVHCFWRSCLCLRVSRKKFLGFYKTKFCFPSRLRDPNTGPYTKSEKTSAHSFTKTLKMRINVTFLFVVMCGQVTLAQAQIERFRIPYTVFGTDGRDTGGS